MWLHVKQTEQSNILIMSPDTDCYHIGMPLNHGSLKDVIVQLNKYTSKEIKFLHLPALLQAIGEDPDLSLIPSILLPQVLSTLFVVTGCDYTSFFSRIGKTTFYRYFFHHAEFITSGRLPGTLADIGLRDNVFEMGFLSFLRLVGVTYFKKKNSGFSQETPEAHFHSFFNNDQTPLCHHKLWIVNIRVIIGDRCHFENEMMPSLDALHRHWKRTCGVLDMWSQANKNNMQLLPMSVYGWKIHNNSLTIDWDSPANVAAVDARVTGLLKGCKCKAGCSTKRYSCMNKGRNCSIGCDCINCTNTQMKENDELLDIVVDEYLTEVTRESSDVPDEANDILDWVFGSEELEYEEEIDEDQSNSI